jgi:SAM-dependent methyltransferase
MKKIVTILLLFLGFVLNVWGQDFKLDVPYVPTPTEVVEKMLTMAKVGKDDMLYDLGCGDGRIVITAAEKYGAKGIGVDLNPVRIAECKANAAKANVGDRVQFMQKDLFETSFKDASVLTLYLLPSVNLKLRPKILTELKPGSRVVSHDFSMGEWEADQTSGIDGDLRSHTIYFWVVPANISGTWELTMKSGTGPSRYELVLEQKFQNVKGSVNKGKSSTPLMAFNLTGDKMKFAFEEKRKGELSTLLFEGKASGDTMEGTVNGTTSWKAVRSPGTMKPLDKDASDKK